MGPSRRWLRASEGSHGHRRTSTKVVDGVDGSSHRTLPRSFPRVTAVQRLDPAVLHPSSQVRFPPPRANGAPLALARGTRPSALTTHRRAVAAYVACDCEHLL